MSAAGFMPPNAPELPTPRWCWEQPNPNHSGASGDLSKLFRNVSVKQPGPFKLEAPPEDATILAREVIQNSWDAAIELRERWAHQSPPPRVRDPFPVPRRLR
jgi:hypothetical protein